MSRPGTATAPPAAADYTRRDLLGHNKQVAAVAWAQSGKRLASASEDGVVKLWNIEHNVPSRTEKSEHDFQHGSKEYISALVFNPKREELLAVVGSNVTKVYDLRTKSSASVICECATPDAISAAWDSHDNLVVSQIKNTFTHIEPRRKRTHKPTVIREGDEVTDLAFIDGRRLLVATRFGVEVWSWPNWEHLTTLSAHAVHHGRDGGVTAIALTRQDRDGKQWLASGGMDAQICLWDLHTATPLSVVYQPDQAVRALSFNADQQMLAYSTDTAQGQQASLDVISVAAGKYLYRIPLSQATECIAFNPRYPKLLAFAAEPLYQGRDSRSNKETYTGRVGIVHFGK